MSITKISPSVVDFDDGITISTTDNSDNLTLTSTDTDANTGPVLNLNRAVTGADDDLLGGITFAGQDDANNAVDYAVMQVHLKDASDGAEDGLIDFQVMSAGTSRSFLILNGGGTIIVNQDAQDIDFRVEGSGNTHALFVQASDDKVGIGVSDPGGLPLHLKVASGDNKLRQETAAKDAFTLGLDNSTGDTIIGTHALYPHTTFVNAGNVSIADGNLVVASGHGIDFAATGDGSGSVSGELLDDYEHGTWTPAINSGTISAGQATYTKIGNIVTLKANISDISDYTTDSDITITGLPYSAGSTNVAIGAAMFRYFTESNAMQMNSYIGNSHNYLKFYWSYNANQTWTPVHFNDGAQANTDIAFTISYKA